MMRELFAWTMGGAVLAALMLFATANTGCRQATGLSDFAFTGSGGSSSSEGSGASSSSEGSGASSSSEGSGASSSSAGGATGSGGSTGSGGNSGGWVVLPAVAALTSARLTSVSFHDADRGIAVGDNGTIIYTTDGGATWSDASVSAVLGTPPLQAVAMVDQTTAHVGGLGRTYWLSTDGGANWADDGSDDPGGSGVVLDVENGTNVWASAHWQNRRWVFRRDGAETWTVVLGAGANNALSNVDVALTGLAVWPAATGDRLLVVFEGGALRYNATGGWAETGTHATWSGLSLRDVAWGHADQTFIVVGDQGKIYKTENAGMLWSQYGDGVSTASLIAVNFADAMTGWVVGEAGTTLHTADGGETWSKVPSGTTENLLDVVAVDGTTTAYATGENGLVLKYTP